MATCNRQTLMTAAAQAGFNYLTPGDQMAVANQLLCNINAGGGGGGGGTFGVAGDAMVRIGGGGYNRDPDTGLYHLGYIYTANGTIPAGEVAGSIGYTFAAIPAVPVYS